MNRPRALPVVLEVLDDGLRLYRRHLAGFTLVATAALVLLALFSLSFMAFVRSEIGTSPGWLFLAFCVLLLLGYPLLLYAFAALSRATAAALDGQSISLISALRINPLRSAGMVFFNALFSVLAGMIAGTLMVVLSCPMTYLSFIMAALFSVVGGGSGAIPASFGLVGVLGQISTLWSLSVAGGWLASIVYAIQAFVLEQRPWRQSASRAIDMLTTGFGQSMLMFLGAGAIFGTLMLSYLGSLLVVWVFVQERLGLSLPPLAGDVIVIVLTVGSLVILLPPLAIWMAMFYRRQARARDGEEIARQVAQWRDRALSVS